MTRNMRNKNSSTTDAEVLADAEHRERVGAYWLTKHVAVELGVSRNSVGRMSIPRHYLDTEKNSERAIVVFVPSEVRAWVKARSTNQDRKAS
jgi:hypothetical protein